MTRAEESIDTKREKKQRNAPFQNVYGKKMLNETQGENRQRYRGGVSESNRKQRADDSGPAPFLQAK
jgi:hypothetical protein